MAGATAGDPLVSVVVPTLGAGDVLAECLRSLESQTYRSFEVIVVDNSGAGLVKAADPWVRVIANQRNVGFGAAVNQAFRASNAPYIATLNDDAAAHPEWLAALVGAAEAHSGAGMFASRVMLDQSGKLDSAGMLLAGDGSSKQRGHGESPDSYCNREDAFFPSGSAALYRRAMFEEIGLFDDDFFLYCEDTDLGLRARWAGWDCVYVSGAVADHKYSHSAGRASPMKAYYVERNRLFLIVKNFPLAMLLAAPFASLVRYFWHLMSMLLGQGKAAEFRKSGHDGVLLPYFVFRAHIVAMWRLPHLLAQRRRLKQLRRITSREFQALARQHWISLRQMGSL